jgi:hypothetical protein
LCENTKNNIKIFEKMKFKQKKRFLSSRWRKKAVSSLVEKRVEKILEGYQEEVEIEAHESSIGGMGDFYCHLCTQSFRATPQAMVRHVHTHREGVEAIRIYKYFSKYGTFYRPMEDKVTASGNSTTLGWKFYLDRIFFFGSSCREGQALECPKCQKKFEWTEGLFEDESQYKRAKIDFFASLEKHKAECGVKIVPKKRKWTRRTVV